MAVCRAGKGRTRYAWAKDRVGQVKEGDRVGVEEAGVESSKDCSVHSHFRSRLSANLMIELEACMATQSWVNREYSRRLSTHPCGAPVLRISVEVLFPNFTIRKSRTQLHSAGFSTS